MSGIMNTVRDSKFYMSCVFLTCMLACNSVSAAQSTVQPVSHIHTAIEKFLHSSYPDKFKLSLTIGKIDPRLRLANCQTSLEAFFPVTARKLGPTTIGVRCLSPVAWQIYVPVQVKAFGTVVVNKHPLTRGTIISTSDLMMATRELSGAIQGYYTTFDQLEGMILKSNLASGSIISPRTVQNRKLVKMGDIVTILAETNGLHIRMKGKAMMDGAKGESIRVKNTRSKRVLQGEVIGSRLVRINL